jgi:hypothetical protein
MGLSTPLHTALFSARHGGPELSPVLHVLRDTLLALAVDVPVAGLACLALRGGRPWAIPHAGAWRVPASPTRRLALNGAMALLVIAPIALAVQNGAELAAAGSGPGAPCPTGASLKTYDVKAIDVDIPLNRFGDRDPNGKMYVLADRVDDVRAQEQSRKVSIGLGDDPIQPLVIRANQGDCVQVNFTNEASGGEYGVHIDGLSYDVASSGDAAGDNDLVVGGQRREPQLPLLRPRRARVRGLALPAPWAGQPRRRVARPLRLARRRAGRLHLPPPDDRQADQLGLGGLDQARHRQGLPRGRQALPRDRQRDDRRLRQGREEAPARRPGHDRLPARHARSQLPLRAVHAPPGA